MSLASDLVARARGSTLTRSTLWMLVGQIARTAIQAVDFLLVAHARGSDRDATKHCTGDYPVVQQDSLSIELRSHSGSPRQESARGG
jgi:hypothetical protein